MHLIQKKMTILQKQLKLKLKFRPFALSVLTLYFLFLSSTLLAHSYADIGEYFLRKPGLAPASYFRINSQPFTAAFSAWHFPTNVTNNSANDPLVNSVNLAYQYEDQDMDALLELRIQEEGLNLEDIIILPPSSDNREELITQLREEIGRYNYNVAAGVTNPHERTILLDLNINRSHWVGIVISV